MIAFFYYMFHKGSGEKFEFEHNKSHNSCGIRNHPSLSTTPWPFLPQRMNFFLLKVEGKKNASSFFCCFSSYVMYHHLPAANRILKYHSCHSKTLLESDAAGLIEKSHDEDS